MARNNGIEGGQVITSGGWWSSMQTDLQDAIDECNTISGAIAAHQHLKQYEAEALIDRIDGQVRQIRKLLEAMVTPI